MTIITQKTVFYVGHIEHLPRHFCIQWQGCFVFGNEAQRHANKGAQQKAEHRLGKGVSFSALTGCNLTLSGPGGFQRPG